jgi:hypothetical protein
LRDQDSKRDVSALLSSYRRPKRQKTTEITVLHPQDEKNIMAEINFREQQRKEAIVRAEMKKLLN